VREIIEQASIKYNSKKSGIIDLGERIVESWMLSTEHKKNILYNYYESEGIGVIVADDELYVTQNFC